MLVLACLVNDVIAALSIAYNLLVGGLLVPIVGALLWRRASPQERSPASSPVAWR